MNRGLMVTDSWGELTVEIMGAGQERAMRKMAGQL